MTGVALANFSCIEKLKDWFQQMLFAVYMNNFEDEFNLDTLGITVLNLSFLNQTEIALWENKVDRYSQKLKQLVEKDECHMKESFLYCILNYLNWIDGTHNCEVEIYGKIDAEDSKHVDILHTGSISEQFGKPLVSVEHLEHIVRDTYQEVESDHDLMVDMLSYPVHLAQEVSLNWRVKQPIPPEQISGEYKFCFLATQTSKGSEFVHLHMKGFLDKPFCSETLPLKYDMVKIPNTLARTYLMEKFGKLKGSTSIDLEVNNEATDDMKMSFSYQGPAINIKINGEDKIIFDADLLLALPLKEWPRFVLIYFANLS